jgi:hypothetical protein
MPLLETVPTVELPPVTPLTFQVTDLFVAFVTVALKVCVRLVRTLALVGEIVTFTAGSAVTVTLFVFDVAPPGLTTLTANVPAVDAVPLAVNEVALPVAVSVWLPNFTVAPLWKPLPMIVSMKGPV